MAPSWQKPHVLAPHAFFPSTVRAQITALACTLPHESGRPLSRWSAAELAHTAKARGIVSTISSSTIRHWLRVERIKPWQHHSWQKSTDPRFLEKATVVLTLYEHAQELARRGEPVVCADEKTCIQALQATGGVLAASAEQPMRVGARYKRHGILNLFTALLVHKGETLARCFERKRFVEFQAFCRMLFGSLWCQGIRVLHLILDSGPTHAPKQLLGWVRTLHLPFTVRIHWLPINASWLDQVELVFSPLQRKALTPRHVESLAELEHRIMAYLAERNKHPAPIAWSYTVVKLKRHYVQQRQRSLQVLASVP
jgi:hypothetical protein